MITPEIPFQEQYFITQFLETIMIHKQMHEEEK
jgi:hypothetical protein